jgi:O-antigen/teichoic acid export membrane protein
VSESGSHDRIVARNFLALGSGEAAARIIAFGVVVYVARALGASAYGVIEVAGAIVLYVGRFADAGFDIGLGVREVAARPNDRELIGTALVARTLISVVLVIGLVAVGLTLVPPPEGPVLAVYSLTLLAVGASTRWVHLGWEQTKPVAIARTLGEALMVVGVILFVRGPEDILRVPFAKLVGDGLAVVLLLWWLVRRLDALPPRPNWSLLRPLAPRAGTLILGTLCGLLIYNADVLIIRLFREAAHVGHYAAAYALISFLSNMAIAYALSLLPTLTRLAERPEEQMKLYSTAHAQVFAASLPIAIAVTFLAGDAIRVVFGAEYAPSTLSLSILIWSVPIGSLRMIPFAAFMTQAREGLILSLTAISAGVNLVLNLVLIPTFGIEGAAVATLATETIRMVIMMRVARRHGFRSPGLERYWRALVAGIPLAAGVWWTRPMGLVVTLAVAAVAYVIGLTLVRGLRWQRGRLPALHV